MQVLYWPRIQLARRAVEEAIRTSDGVEPVVVETFEDALAAIGGVDGVVMPDAPVALARQLLERREATGARAKWLHILTAGREGLEGAGLPVDLAVSGPDGSIAPTVAEHGMTMVLALKRRIPAILANQANGVWDRSISESITSLEGERMLLVGYGSIGRAYAQRARAFGMEVSAVTRTPKPGQTDVHALDALPDLLPTADLVVLAIAVGEKTRGLFDAHAFAAMKRTAIIVNSARGAIIDSTALVAALHAGEIGGAALDATSPEPLPADNPLWRCPNTIISPHIGGSGSTAAQKRLAETVRKAIARNSER